MKFRKCDFMEKFYPEIYQKSIYTINYEKLKEKKIKCLLFDLDNTCIPYKSKELPQKLLKLFDKLSKMGFKVIVFSNSSKKRLSKLSLNVEYNASSKKPFSHNFKKIMNKYKFKANETCIIGDQLLTDILGGNILGIHTCLIEPLTDIDMFITNISRKVENIIFKKLSKQNKLIRGKYYD